MTIMIRLKTDNAAFEDDKQAEVTRILAGIVESHERRMSRDRGNYTSNLYDSNGNIVGTVTVTGK